jgi:hypothetical protein
MMFRLSPASRSRSVGIATSETILLHYFVLGRMAIGRIRWASVDQDHDKG